jgi:SAM-dependent methyltransferase
LWTDNPIRRSGAMRDLTKIAEELLDGANDATKTLSYYAVYQRYFNEISDNCLKVLELGTYEGVSTKIFSRYFKNSTIISVDLIRKDIDFSRFENVVYLQADQSDESSLASICDRYAPDGLDIVIDDASHIGYYSLRSFRALFARLKYGGYYVVEDWGTGYWNDWPDGHQSRPVRLANRNIFSRRLFPRRILSHDYGMVGFIKSLIDEVAGHDNRPSRKSPPMRPAEIEYMHTYHALAILKRKDEEKQ